MPRRFAVSVSAAASSSRTQRKAMPPLLTGPAHHPAVFGQQVAEGTAAWIGTRLIDDRPHRAARTDGDGDVPWPDCIDTEIGQHAVIRPDNERNARRKADIRSERRIETGHVMRGRHRNRQLFGRDAGQSQRAVVPGEPFQIEQACG
jgi:hypothetical protein